MQGHCFWSILLSDFLMCKEGLGGGRVADIVTWCLDFMRDQKCQRNCWIFSCLNISFKTLLRNINVDVLWSRFEIWWNITLHVVFVAVEKTLPISLVKHSWSKWWHVLVCRCLCQSKSRRWQMTSVSVLYCTSQSATETGETSQHKDKEAEICKQETFDVVTTKLWLSCFEHWSFERFDAVTTNKRITSVMFWSPKPTWVE